MTIDYRTKDAVRQQADAVRRKHGALDWSARVDDLIKLEGLDQGTFGPNGDGLGQQLRLVFARVTKKIKALVSVKDGLILLAQDLPRAKNPFAKGHELGHNTLPWHKDILYVCDEHDLSVTTREQMEWEANTFASEVLIPASLLSPIYKSMPISMETVLWIAQKSGASIEACAYAYVSNHEGKCAMMVLESVQADGIPALKLARKVLSESGVKSPLSQLKNGQMFAQDHVLYINSRGSTVGVCLLHLTGTEKNYPVTVFNPPYSPPGLSPRARQRESA